MAGKRCMSAPTSSCAIVTDIPFQIAYVSILGPVLVAALVEWFLWLAAFLYCLAKVFQKADRCSVRVLAVVMMFLFSGLR